MMMTRRDDEDVIFRMMQLIVFFFQLVTLRNHVNSSSVICGIPGHILLDEPRLKRGHFSFSVLLDTQGAAPDGFSLSLTPIAPSAAPAVHLRFHLDPD